MELLCGTHDHASTICVFDNKFFFERSLKTSVRIMLSVVNMNLAFTVTLIDDHSH